MLEIQDGCQFYKKFRCITFINKCRRTWCGSHRLSQDSMKTTFFNRIFHTLSNKTCCQKQIPGELSQNGHFQDGRHENDGFAKIYLKPHKLQFLTQNNNLSLYIYVFKHGKSNGAIENFLSEIFLGENLK